MRNAFRFPLAIVLAAVCGFAIAPPAEAGPLCEPPPPPVCASAFALCKAATPDACGACEAAEVLETCVKCLADESCDPLVIVCDLVADACKGAGDYDQDCDAQRADCLALDW